MKEQMSVHYQAFFTVGLWSSAYVLTKVALDHFSSPALGFIRCAVAAAALGALMAARRAPLPRAHDLPWLFCSGAVGFAVYLLTFNKGTETLSPTTSCLIISTTPIISAVMARVFFGEVISKRGWGAIGCAFTGVAVMMVQPASADFTSGALWMLAAAVAISSYNILQRKLSLSYDPLLITGYSFIAATILLGGFAPDALGQVRAASGLHLALALFLGIFPSALAYQLWAKAISQAAKTSTVTNYMFLTPFLTVILEYAVIRELPGLRTIAGGGIIIASLLLYTRTGDEKNS